MPSARSASLAFMAGGLLMAVLWLVYTTVHGPTSFDQTGVVLGRSTLFWSLLLSVPPSLSVAQGLVVLRPHFDFDITRTARIGYGLAMIGLIVPVGLDLFVWGALGPPFFVPVLGTGLTLLAYGSWRSRRLPRHSLYALTIIGVSQIIAFALAAMPLALSDRIGGYRLYGLVAHLLTGLGWVALGAGLWKTPSLTPAE